MTDRAVRTPEDVAALSFNADGLLPVVAQDAGSGAVLMVAWANREAVEATLETDQLHFWSRSRGELWRKGETSGNTLTLVSLHADCDGDTLLAVVRPGGPACHTGERTCFGEGAGPAEGGRRRSRGVLDRLEAVLRSRAAQRPKGSYTTKLLDDENLRLKKLGEESAELVAALAKGDRDRSVQEAADLLYHLLVALRAEEVGLDDVRAALDARAG
jgi:phosphoribosyl-ATP pyrophosphohydrolase/phosphoribosyl-AMP cyclohydrolase